MANNNEVRFDINAVVTGNQEIKELQDQLESFGENNSAISNSVEALVDEVNKISEASKLIRELADANNKVSESATKLDEAKQKYNELADSVEEFKQANDPEGLRNAQLALKAQEREVLRLTTANNRAADAQEALNRRIDESNVANLVRDQEALARAGAQVAQSQEMLNARLTETIQHNSDRRLLNVDGAREQQEKIEELREAYQRLADGGELTAQELQDAHRNMERGIEDINNGMQETVESSDGVEASFKKMAVAALSFAGIAATIKSAINAAIEFEAAMGDVGKTFDDLSSEKLKNMGDGLIKLTREIPLTAVELAKIAEAGGQLGIAADDLNGFVSVVAKMSIAFNMTAEEAGKAIGNLKTIFRTSIEQTEALGDAINQLENNLGVKSAEIIDVMTRIGTSATSFGLANEEVAALSATFLKFGMSPEIAATAIKTFLNTMQTAEKQSVGFQDALNEIGMTSVGLAQSIRDNPIKAIQDISESLSNLEGSKQANVFTEIFGKQHQSSMKTFVLGADEFQKALALIADKSKYAGLMQSEFSKKSQTTANQLKLLSNAANETAINLGSTFLPAINEIAKSLTSATQAMAEFSKENPSVVKYGVTLAAIAVAVKVLTSTISFFATTATTAFATATAGAARFTASLNLSTAAAARLSAATSKIGTSFKWLAGVGASAFAGWSFGTWLQKEFVAVNQFGTAIAAGVHSLFTRISGYSRALWSTIKLDTDGAKTILKDMEAELKQIEEGYSDIAVAATSGDQKRAAVEKLAAEEKIKKSLEEQREKLRQIEETSGKIAAIRSVNKDGIFSQEAADSIARVDNALKLLNLSFDAVEKGISEAGNAAIMAFDQIAGESQATSNVITQGFVAALGQIETPKELEILRERLELTAKSTQLAAEDLALLTPILNDMDAQIKAGLTPGAEFDNQLKNWATNASNTAKGITTLTAEQQKLTTSIEKEITLINALSEAHIKDLKSQMDLAKAKGEMWKVADLANKITIAELDLNGKLTVANQKKLALDKQILAGLNAKIARNEKLTESEIEQKAALELAVIENETAIAVYERSAEVKRMEAAASGAVIQGNEGIAASASEAAAAVSEATAAVSEQASAVDEASKSNKKASETMTYSSGNIAGSARNWEMISEATKQALRDTTKYWGHLPAGSASARSQAAEIDKQVKRYDALSKSIGAATEMTEQQIKATLASIGALGMLDEAKLNALRDQLQKFKDKSDEAAKSVTNLAQTAQDEITKATQKLDELTGKNRKNVQSEQLRLESAAAEAAAQGNMEAAEKFLEAARLQAEIVRQERLAVQRKQNEEKRKQDEQASKVMGRYQIDMVSEQGEKVTSYTDDKMAAQTMVRIISESKRNAIRR